MRAPLSAPRCSPAPPRIVHYGKRQLAMPSHRASGIPEVSLIPHFARPRFAVLTALFLAAPISALPAQGHPLSLSFGAGFVAQRQTGPTAETAIGYTAVLGLSRPIGRKLRLHADARYSFDLALGPVSSICYSACAYNGLSTTKVLSTVLGVEYLTSQRRVGLLFRAGTGLHLLAYPSPGRSGIYPGIATALGLRVPFGGRGGSFLVEGRYDQVFNVVAGPSRLMPLMFGFEF